MIKYLTPDEAAGELLGWTGRRRGRALLRVILRKEHAEKREIAVRIHGAQRVRYKVTEPMLRLHFPELFTSQIDALAAELYRRLEELKATIGAEVDERMAPQVQRLRAEHDRLTASVAALTHDTDEGLRRIERRMRELEQKAG